jgi:hypothetical protein
LHLSYRYSFLPPLSSQLDSLDLLEFDAIAVRK